MPCRCEDPDYSHIIAGIFDQCMSQTKEIVSFVFGWLSIVSWVVALYPQIRLNFLLRKAEALSPYFLLCWFVGDIFNTTSCFVLDQLFVQKFLGVFWLSTDVILNSSHFYFLLTKKKYTSSATHFRVLEIFIYVVIDILMQFRYTCQEQSRLFKFHLKEGNIKRQCYNHVSQEQYRCL
ncbi:Seven_transmembrane protein 1 [Hexamita inflata]|uniref:Seven transmembrane protein 1 n=1 Tax=Hexamita inflata TaxID=28002 RepID=A0AA86Q385_9EUKA|nr:Seven transmembrane protein 1 [Hexamita inflata]